MRICLKCGRYFTPSRHNQYNCCECENGNNEDRD